MEKNLDNSNEKKKPGSEGRIQSLERAFAVLEETARHKNGISLSDLSRKLNLHTSTLYHLTKTLTSLGYLGMGDNKRYRVGRSIYQLASKCFDDIDLTATCQPFLERLAFETGESSHFAVWEKKNVFLMSRVSGTNSLQLNEGAGTMRPVHCTAIGKVLLTGFPPEEFEAILHDIEFEQFTANTLTSPEELRAQVEKARIEGVAFDDCEYNAEVRCMAAPVFNFNRKIIGAIGFSGPIWRTSLADMAKYIPVTKSIARDLSIELGFTTEENAGE
jgi:DNA-binding IclR family transcriptional regulator